DLYRGLAAYFASMRPRRNAEDFHALWFIDQRLHPASMRPRRNAEDFPLSVWLRKQIKSFNEASAECRGLPSGPGPGDSGGDASMRPRRNAEDFLLAKGSSNDRSLASMRPRRNAEDFARN